eukprot:scaffold219398_cov33-Tisochrysis_lutea.AAC.1
MFMLCVYYSDGHWTMDNGIQYQYSICVCGGQNPPRACRARRASAAAPHAGCRPTAMATAKTGLPELRVRGKMLGRGHPESAGSPAARSAVAGLGAGVGIGMGYTDCKHEFDVVDKAAATK